MGFALGILGLIGLWYASSLKKKRHQELIKLSNDRQGQSKSSFFELYMSKGYDPELIEVVYKNLQSFLGNTSFLFDHQDHLVVHYKLTKDEIKDLLIDICLDLQFPFPKNKEIETFEAENKTINTFEQLLSFLVYFKQSRQVA